MNAAPRDARARAASPVATPLERARKVLLHEQRTGFADRAAVGGLERFLRRLAAAPDAAGATRARLERAAAHAAGYATRPPSERERSVAQALADLAGPPRTGNDENSAAVAELRRTSPPDPPLERQEARGKRQETSPPGPLSHGKRGDAGRDWPSAGARPLAASGTQAPTAPPPALPARPWKVSIPGVLAGGAAPAVPPPTVGPSRPATPATARPKVPSLSPLAPVGDLPGVGAKSVAALARLQIHSVKDLLYHLPRRHLDRRSVTPIADLAPGAPATIYGTVWQVQTKRTPLQRLLITDAIVQDESGFCHAIWFNQPYLARTLSRPGRIVLSGKVEYGGDGALQLVAPELEFDSGDLLHTGRLVPFYPKTEGLTDRQLRSWLRLALAATEGRVDDPVPPGVRDAERLLGLGEALAQAHFPDDDAARAEALRRLAFDEFLLIQLGVLRRRREWQETQPGVEMRVEADALREFCDRLPFKLTGAQRRAIDDILADMARPVPMSRLLQGEVGSGKTAVAAAACLVARRSGYQAALMAPTEVLAQQHHRSLARLLAPCGVRVELVTGSQKRKEKAQVWEACRRGEVGLLVGTHALIQEEGDFARLGLAIVDEQHRFGVRQRGALRRKGYNPDLLVMTATPIPRTLALSIYGDLNISVLNEMPPGRRQIQTFWAAPEKRHLAYEFVRKQVRGGRQAFIICPLVEESDKVEARSAKAEHERLSRQFPDLRLGLLHGKMAPRDKERVMAAFRDGAHDVLVSTAVVEVGIDVPNATIVLIEGADRFGLAQLHQFRGRVGRGEHQSYCILLSDSADAEQNPRLRVVVENHDGFALADEDLKLRGPGEFFGTRQSGLPDLKVAKLSDVAVLEAARRQAQRLCQTDPLLQAPEHAALAARVEAFWRSSVSDSA